MDTMTRILLVFALTTIPLVAKYVSLDEAFKNGISRGDAIVYNVGTKYVNGSVGIGYTTGFYYAVRGAISFRAMKFFYGSQRRGRDFYSDSLVVLDQSFVEYFDGDTAIKAGRFLPISYFANNLIDGVWVRNGSFENSGGR